jgi:hypothetical protein
MIKSFVTTLKNDAMHPMLTRIDLSTPYNITEKKNAYQHE